MTDLRHGLIHLHKTLLDWERVAYEREHGRLSSQQLLDTIMADPQFAWLRRISGLIVRIDEMLDNESPDTPGDVGAIVEHARWITALGEGTASYIERYRAALQDSPAAVLAHRDVVMLLRRHPEGREHPTSGPH